MVVSRVVLRGLQLVDEKVEWKVENLACLMVGCSVERKVAWSVDWMVVLRVVLRVVMKA